MKFTHDPGAPGADPSSAREPARLTRRRFAAAACASAFLPSLHAAQDYPSKASRIVVPLGAGGSMDPMARALASGLADSLGQAVYVENKTGAAGQIAADAVAKTPGDPYNLFLGSMGIMSISPALYPSLPYDVKRDFTPIALCALLPYALVVNPSVVPVRTVAEFVQWAKAQKAPVAYGTVGSGSLSHIGSVMLGNAASLNLTQVPYRTPAQISTDMVKGDLPMIIDAPAAYMGFATEGRLRILAVTSRQRMAILPDVPTMSEAGIPGFELVNWFGLFAPRELPAGAAERLRASMAQILQSKKLREQFAPMGLEIAADGAADFAGFSERDRTRWQTFLQRNNIKLDKM